MFNQGLDWQQQQLTGNQILSALSRQYMHQFKNRDIALEEVNLIYQQNSILKQIKNSLTNKNKTSFLTQSDDNQALSRQYQRPPISFRRTNDGTLPLRSRASIRVNQQQPNKIKREFDMNQFQKALTQVEQKCESEVFKCLNFLFNSYKEIQKKLTDASDILNNITKQSKTLQNLKREYTELQKKFNQQEKKLKKQELQLNAQKQTVEKDKKVLNNLVERQRILGRSQTALLIKQRLLNQNLKKLNTKTASIKKHEDQVNQQRRIVQDLWQQIMTKSEFDQEFKHQIYNKCKDNLMKQRNILSQQQEQLQKQHCYIQKIISQLNGLSNM